MIVARDQLVGCHSPLTCSHVGRSSFGRIRTSVGHGASRSPSIWFASASTLNASGLIGKRRGPAPASLRCVRGCRYRVRYPDKTRKTRRGPKQTHLDAPSRPPMRKHLRITHLQPSTGSLFTSLGCPPTPPGSCCQPRVWLRVATGGRRGGALFFRSVRVMRNHRREVELAAR